MNTTTDWYQQATSQATILANIAFKYAQLVGWLDLKARGMRPVDKDRMSINDEYFNLLVGKMTEEEKDRFINEQKAYLDRKILEFQSEFNRDNLTDEEKVYYQKILRQVNESLIIKPN